MQKGTQAEVMLIALRVNLTLQQQHGETQSMPDDQVISPHVAAPKSIYHSLISL